MSKKKDFFISYTRRDESWATWVAKTLEAERYTTIIQAWDFNTGDNFIEKMDLAIQNTERFIAILSEKYLNSPFCKTEWVAAYAKDINLEKAIFIPVRIEKIVPCGIFADVACIDLVGLSEESAIDALLQGVLRSGAVNVVGNAGTRKPKYPGDMPANNLPHSRNQYFSGRVEKFKEMHNSYASGDRISHTQCVAGLGGVGKTAFAIEYAYRYSYEYEAICWVDAETFSSVINSYMEFARQKRIVPDMAKADEIIEAVTNWFDSNENWLLVYDNADADDLKKWLEPCFPKNAIGHILVTTRSSSFPGSRPMDLSVFSEDEAVLFLRERTQKEGDGYSEELAKALAECLQCLPLALEQAAAYIVETPDTTYQDYIHLLDEHGIETFEKENYLVDYTSIVNLTWNISMEKITNKASLQMFNICAYFAPDRIPVDMFVRGSSALMEPLQTGIVNSLERNAILYDITRYSLLTVERNNDTPTDEKRVLYMHRLLQEVVRQSHKKTHEWLVACLDLGHLLAKWNPNDIDSIRAFRTDASHIEKIASLAVSLLSSDTEKTRQIDSILHFLVVMHLVSYDLDTALRYNAMRLAMLTEKCKDSGLLADRFSLFLCYLNQGQICTQSRALEEALEYLNECVQMGELLRNESERFDDSKLALAYMARGVVYEYKRMRENALADKNRGVAIYECILGENGLFDENELANAYLNRGATYSSMEMYAKAFADYSKSIEIWEKLKEEGGLVDEGGLAKAYFNIDIDRARKASVEKKAKNDKKMIGNMMKGIMAANKD